MRRAVLLLVLAIAALWPAAAAATVVETWTHPQASVETCSQSAAPRPGRRRSRRRSGSTASSGPATATSASNTGPTSLTSLMPSTGTWGTATSLPTEEISQFRNSRSARSDTLDVPFTDAIGLGFSRPDDASGVSLFSAVHKFGSAHVFDMAKRPGTPNDIWACGSDNRDDGTVWELDGMREDVVAGPRRRAARPLRPRPVRPFLLVRVGEEGVLRPALERPAADVHAPAQVRAARGLVDDRAVIVHLHARRPTLCRQARLPRRAPRRQLRPGPGDERRFGVDHEPRCLGRRPGPGRTHPLPPRGTTVYGTVDPVNWNVEATAPTDATSLEVVGGTVYVGTSESEIHEID